jgi:hypothetical protein
MHTKGLMVSFIIENSERIVIFFNTIIFQWLLIISSTYFGIIFVYIDSIVVGENGNDSGGEHGGEYTTEPIREHDRVCASMLAVLQKWRRLCYTHNQPLDVAILNSAKMATRVFEVALEDVSSPVCIALMCCRCLLESPSPDISTRERHSALVHDVIMKEDEGCASGLCFDRNWFQPALRVAVLEVTNLWATVAWASDAVKVCFIYHHIFVLFS